MREAPDADPEGADLPRSRCRQRPDAEVASAAAVAAWNASSLEFMAETLKAAKALRPHAAWGYYGMIGCFARWDVAEGTCDAEIRARNDALAPLWSAGTALFPSIYSECSFAPGPDGVMRCQPGGPPIQEPRC